MNARVPVRRWIDSAPAVAWGAYLARVLAGMLAAASLAGPTAVAADQQDPRLGDLFVALSEAPDSGTALTIESAIWRIWLDGGDSKLNELMAQGIEAMGSHRFRDAAGRFTELILAAPAFAEAWNKRATVYYLMDRLEDSVRDIERTLALEPRHFGAISGMGLIFLQRGDEEGALGAFEKVLEIHPHARGARFHVERLRERLRGKRIRGRRTGVRIGPPDAGRDGTEEFSWQINGAGFEWTNPSLRNVVPTDSISNPATISGAGAADPPASPSATARTRVRHSHR